MGSVVPAAGGVGRIRRSGCVRCVEWGGLAVEWGGVLVGGRGGRVLVGVEPPPLPILRRVARRPCGWRGGAGDRTPKPYVVGGVVWRAAGWSGLTSPPHSLDRASRFFSAFSLHIVSRLFSISLRRDASCQAGGGQK